MPRKKTIQPEPLLSFPLTMENGELCEIEVRDDTCNIIGRGLHNRDRHEELCDRVLEYVVEKHLSSDGPRKGVKPFMDSARDLDAELALSGLFPEITDLGSVRKRIYPYVRDQLNILTKLVNDRHL